MREVPARSAHLPDSLVGAVPDALEELHDVALERPGMIVGREAVHTCLVQRVHHLAVHVELELLVGRVPDAHRLRAGVPGSQPSSDS